MLCDIFTLKKSRGGGSIINIDLQFINSGAHFSKCQAAFSTMVSGLFFALRRKQSGCSLVKSRWWETRQGFFFYLFLFLSSQLAEKHSDYRGTLKCLETRRRQGWRSGTVPSHGCVNFCALIEGTNDGLAQQGSFRSETFRLEYRQISIGKAICVKTVSWVECDISQHVNFLCGALCLSEMPSCLSQCHIW